MLDVSSIANPEAQERNRKNPKNNPWADGMAGPCLLCGRAVKEGSGVMVHLHMGGGTIVTEAEAKEWEAKCAADPNRTSDSGDLGGYPIGPECYRKHKSVLKPYVEDFARAQGAAP